jgi:iron-sulfur cluster assembly protein
MSTTPETKTDNNEAAAEATQEPVLAAKQRAQPVREGQDIHLSDVAAEKVREYLAKDNHPDTMYLFVGVKGGGCSGLSYVLDLRDEANSPVKDSDEVFESKGILIVCDLKSYVVGNLTGTTIDYQEGMMGAGFVFNNPNAKSTCGCGSSYTA